MDSGLGLCVLCDQISSLEEVGNNRKFWCYELLGAVFKMHSATRFSEVGSLLAGAVRSASKLAAYGEDLFRRQRLSRRNAVEGGVAG